jgi:hypothetical protein
MTEDSTTIQAEQSKTTTNYAVYDSPDGDEQQELVGTYITESVADQLGEYVEFELSDGEGDGLSLTADRETSSFVVFSSEADAVESAYVSHEALDRIGADADSTVDMLARSSSEEAFQQALDEQTTSEEETEQEANALLGDDDSDSDESEAEPSEESEAENLTDEEVEISDDELGLAE